MGDQPLGDVEGSDDHGNPTFLYLVGRLDRVVRQAIASVVRTRGLSVNQYTTLSVLDHRSGLSNAQLARRALVSPQAMNEVLLTLEKRGLVRRHAHPEHGRIRPARLTAKGRSLLVACDAEVKQVDAAMLIGLSDGERTAFRAALLSGIRSLQGGLEKTVVGNDGGDPLHDARASRARSISSGKEGCSSARE
jgi:DNA-binding MarR family transcriptional regulator